MPLVKLLKSVFGGSESKKPAEKATATARRSNKGKRKQASPTTPTVAQQPIAAEPAKPVASKRSVLNLVSGGPHGSLCRMIKKLNAHSVLEVGIGDGSRAAAVLTALGKSRPASEIRYIAIDEFEMAGGPVSLRQFNQQIRSIGVKPNLIPMPVPQGLTRVAHTFGQVDLVLIGQIDGDLDHDLLARVTGPDSVILRFAGQSWQQISQKVRDQSIAA